MKSSFISACAFFAVVSVLSACEKTEPMEPVVDYSISNPNSLLTNCDIEQINVDEGDEVYRFIYGEQNRLENILLGSLTEEGVFEEEDDYDLIYTNGRLSSVETADGNLVHTYEYNSEGLVSTIREIDVLPGGQEESIDINRRVYDTENRLVEVVRIQNVGKETETGEYSDVFEWVGANVSKVTSFYNPKDDSNGRLLAQKLGKKHFPFRKGARSFDKRLSAEEVNSNFDDKRNPLMYLLFVFSGANGLLISENNPRIREHTAFLTDGTTIKMRDTIELEYDPSGRPRAYTITETEEGWSPKTYEIEIKYKN